MRRRIWTALFGALLLTTVVTLWAQEAQMINRPVNVTVGNLSISRGTVIAGGGVVRDFRAVTAVTTEAAVTYTAAQVLTGLIVRSADITARTDVLPTAADLVAGMPGVQAGSSFWLMFDRGAAAGATITLNGASTGVTYGGGCATALATADGMVVLITITSSTAYRATCVKGDV